MGHSSTAGWIWGHVRPLTALMLLFYVLRRRNLDFRVLNLWWSGRDLRIGVFLFVAARSAEFVGHLVVRNAFLMVFGTNGVVHSPLQVFGRFNAAAVPYILLSPVFEELIARAYWMNEVRELTGSAVLAVEASSMMQASHHLYYGWAAALSLWFGFLTFAMYHALWKRALPTIVAHEIWAIFATIHWYLR